MVITMTREDILRRLETRLEVAKAEDKRAAAEHKKAEQAAEKKYKDMIRAHLSLDWKTLKKAQPIYVQSPSCPRLQAPYIQSKIDAMKLDARKAPYRLSESSDIYLAMNWVPDRLKQKLTVCD